MPIHCKSLILAALLLMGALTPHAPSSSAQAAPRDWDYRWWINKTARALRGGSGIQRGESMAKLEAMTPEQVADRFLADPRFADTVLKFNLFFLGFPIDRSRTDSGEVPTPAIELPHATVSAREVLKGGDFLKLLTLDQPVLIPPLEDYAEAIPSQPGDELLTPKELRAQIKLRILAAVDRSIALAETNPPLENDALCTEIERELEDRGGAPDGLGLSQTITNTLIRGDSWLRGLYVMCDGATPDKIAAKLKQIRGQYSRLFEEMNQWEPDVYQPKGLDQVLEFDRAAYGVTTRNLQFTYPLRRLLVNSSTNFNRKRGAYMLQRFFCDDLTPINVQVPAAHAQGKHGTDPSCYSCHHKLDPMSGFFKQYGRRFYNYSANTRIVFDDDARMPYAEFQKSWLEEDPSLGRKFNIGYIRSSEDLSINTYGENLDDLFAIIQSAPEVKRCIVKRTWEYLNSSDQAVDPAFLDELTQMFTEKAKVNSTDALKAVVRKIVLGNTFKTSNPETNRCYDRAPGTPVDGPCKVYSILQTSCVGCHKGGTQGAMGGLDLTSWIQDSEGRWTFAHRRAGGPQLSRRETMGAIADRLNTANDARRMPMGKEMGTASRDALYLWAQEMAR